MKKQGFTLLELLMVIIVIGILVSFSMPAYQNFISKTQAAEAINVIAHIRRAQEMYYLQYGSFANEEQLKSFFIIENTDNWQYSIRLHPSQNAVEAYKQSPPDNATIIRWNLGHPGEWSTDAVGANNPYQPGS